MYELPKTSKTIFKDEKSLEHSQLILHSLGDPQDAHKTIHVAGTSGKGSVCYLIDAILRAHGKRTGLMVSPHVYDIRERIQINGQMLSERKFSRLINKMLTSLRGLDASYFNILTAFGFLASSRERIDYLIVETGFGGLWDTTNTISRKDKLSVITQIGFDHTAILGNSITEIAAQKAGIIKQDGEVLVMDQDQSVLDVFKQTAQKKNANLHIVPRLDDYQSTNDNMAKEVVKKLAKRDGWVYKPELAGSVLSTIYIPGRFEKRNMKNHTVILDGAHNPQKLEALSGRLESEGFTPATFVFAIGERKDWQQCIDTIQPYAKRVIATEFFTAQSDMTHHATKVGLVEDYCRKRGIEVYSLAKPIRALNKALEFDEAIVVTGSFYLLGEVDKFF